MTVPLVPIADVRALVDPVNWVPLDTNALHQVEGFVTPYVNLSPTNDTSFYLQDDTGGISVYVSGRFTNKPLRADKARVIGRLSHFNGLLQLHVIEGNPTNNFTMYGTNFIPEVTPITLTC